MKKDCEQDSLRVLHILNELQPSGAEVMMHCAASYWQAYNVEAEILSTGETVGVYAPELEKVGYEIHHLPFKKSPFFFLSFYNLLCKQKYDVIHIHCERANFYYGLIAGLTGAKVVRTIHSNFTFRGFLGLKRKFQRKILRLAGCTHVAVSSSVKNTESEFFENPTTLIANWCDCGKFTPPTLEQRLAARHKIGVNKDTFVIVTIGNCSPVKNHSTLIEALSNLAKGLNFIYLHIGEEQTQYPERQLSESLGISARVRFLGYIKDVSGLLHAADAYVMPSLYEGFGIAAIEALASGISGIFTEVLGLQDLKDIDGTFLAKPDVESLAEALKHVAKIPLLLRQAMGRKAHEKVKNLYGIERGVRVYVDLYREKN